MTTANGTGDPASQSQESATILADVRGEAQQEARKEVREEAGGTVLEGIRSKVFLDRYARKGEDGTPLEQYPEQMWRRVAAGIAAVEPTPEKQAEWTERFYGLLRDFKFVPGGRILSGAGTGHQVTYYNCYVVGLGEDPLDPDALRYPRLDPTEARPAFFNALGQMTDIMSRSGGVGINLSALPPRGTPIAAPGRAANAGATVRPTVALSLAHPDVTRLLDEKDGPNLSHVDIAVIVPRAFDQALRNDEDWTPRWEDRAGDTMRARALWARVTSDEGRKVGILRPDAELLRIDDSRDAIVSGAAEVAQRLYQGQATVVDFSRLRPRGAYIKTVNGTSSGPVAWMYLFDAVARLDDGGSPAEKGVIWFGEIASTITGKTIQQGGSRRGALMLMLDDDHPDVEEFIAAKRIGPDGRPVMIEHANMSLCVSDRFMEAVKADLPWDLVWQGRVVRTIRARDMWDRICTAAWTTAEPGVVFMERYQDRSNTYYFENIRCVNPCVTGDTLIYTAAGLYPAAELAELGTPVTVTSPDNMGDVSFKRASHVFPTGVKRIYKLQTTDGYTLRLTADHKVLTTRGWKEAQQLVSGDRIRLLNGEGGFGISGSMDKGRVLGWLVGDGCINTNRTKEQPSAMLSFWGTERALAPSFADAVNRLVAAPEGGRQYHITVTNIEDRDESRVTSVRLVRLIDPELLIEKLQVPPSVFRGSREMQQGFLQALFSADGTVLGMQEKGVSVRLTSTSMPLLEGVQRLLLNFGIAAKIYRNRRVAGKRSLPDGHGGHSEYDCQAYHELVIARANLCVFAAEIGFLQDEKQSKLEARLQGYARALNREKFVATFESLTPDGEEMVYDLTEPQAHLFVGNGLVLHNCGEQGLPPGGVCNLGALNLERYVNGEGRLLEDDLARDAAYATRFLDDVIDATPYFRDLHVQMQREGTRRTGLGTMGLADALIRMEVGYGSPASLETIDRIYRIVRDASYRESVELAREKGPFGRFDRDKYLQGWFIGRLPGDIQEGIREHGIRNGVLLTQAPTGTTSLLAGVSSGIEPVFDFAMKRVDRTGEHIMYHPLYQAWRDAHPGEERPDFFVGAKDLTPEEHIVVQAKVQEYTDSSISKTANVPHDFTVDNIKDLYMQAYDLGCKGVTCYRDGSRDAVLTSVTEKPKETAPISAPIAAQAADDGASGPATLPGLEPLEALLPVVETDIAVPLAPPVPVSASGPSASAPARTPAAPATPTAPATATPASASAVATDKLDKGGATPGGIAAPGMPTWVLDGRLKRRPNEMPGFTQNVTAPEGKVNITINSDPDGPLELFINVGRAGTDIAALAEALGRLISLQLRLPSTMSQEERLRQVANQLRGIGGSRSIGFGKHRVLSLPDAVAQAIYRHLEEHPAPPPAHQPVVPVAQLALLDADDTAYSASDAEPGYAGSGAESGYAGSGSEAGGAGVTLVAIPATMGSADPIIGATATPIASPTAAGAPAPIAGGELAAQASAAGVGSGVAAGNVAGLTNGKGNGGGNGNGHGVKAVEPAQALVATATLTGNLCPQCGSSGAYVFEEGCKKCHYCGYSEC